MIKKDKLFNIGYRYTFELSNGDILEIISFFNGKREIYYLKDSKIKCNLQLTEEEAKELGFILADLKEVEEVPILKDKVLMDWVTIKDNFYASNKKIKELKIRTLTGATIIAIERDNNIIAEIKPETEIKPGDKLLLIGPLISIEKAKKILRGGL